MTLYGQEILFFAGEEELVSDLTNSSAWFHSESDFPTYLYVVWCDSQTY